MSSVAGKTIIITGSSRGVGADTAKILASQGWLLYTSDAADDAPRV